MSAQAEHEATGGCDCRGVRYAMRGAPLIVHCCHCRWCQRESGAAFALNALIEADRVVLLAGAPEAVLTPSASGKGQTIWRCPVCRIALWSNYAGAGDVLRFVRVGTLDDPDARPPDIHIFTESKQPWVVIPAGARAVPQYYKSAEVWSAASLARRRLVLGK
ncbi:MAG: GFA family protein [Gammaproteobacteria bacterium]|nr:GFA family protein [Gammaproteobacteria bacterium]